MRIQHLLVICCASILALLVSGCECSAESDGELCDVHDARCGEATLIDDCGQERTVDCGACDDDQSCDNHQCVCEGEYTEVLCDDIDADCGTHQVTDACGDDRQIDCGGCSDPDECVDGMCACMGQSDADLCDEYGLDCGEASVEDACGDPRQIDCGGCSDPDQCIDNHCECVGESDDQLCDDAGVDCGETTLQDQCGDTHTVDCGGCSDPDQCVDNRCECVGESDDELCDDIPGACGTIETTDQCGDTRSVDCQPCPDGDTTFGAVRDGETGELLDDADIRVYQWPPPEGQDHDWVWDTGHRSDDPDFSTTTTSTDGDFNFEFATDESICIDDQVDAFEPYQWYRIVVDRSGYDPGVFYRVHGPFENSECPSICATTGSTGCYRQDFELFSDDSDYAQYPNLIADVRELQEHEFQCTQLPDDADYDELIGLRVRLGGANIGPGPFHLEGITVDGGDDQVLQYVERSSGSVDSYTVDSNTFYDHQQHGHTHFMNWFRLSLVDPVDECRDVDDRSDSCITHDGQKISFCLHDFAPFDGDVGYYYDGLMSMFPDPPTCDSTEQGVTAGWIDVYNKYLPGQALILGEPDDIDDIGTRFIEAEIDPDQVLEEVERYGNVAHLEIDIPSDGSSICADSERVLDCSMPSDEYTTTAQHRQCGDYLDYAGVD